MKLIVGIEYLNIVFGKFVDNNVNIICLDVVGYVIKEVGINCFMLDEMFEYLNKFLV